MWLKILVLGILLSIVGGLAQNAQILLFGLGLVGLVILAAAITIWSYEERDRRRHRHTGQLTHVNYQPQPRNEPRRKYIHHRKPQTNRDAVIVLDLMDSR